MKTVLLAYHLAAVLLAAIALWSMRHEFNERATTRLAWAVPPALAVVVAAVLLIVSPGKRFELWAVGIVAGLAIGMGAGVILKVNKDFERKLVRVHRTWDGIGAAALLLLAALARIVSSDVVTRQSGKFGVLGAAAAFLAAYLSGRAIAMYFYTAPRTIHLDMVYGERARTS
jgi:ABC-type polysaccharide transport system permease subunit